MAAPPESGSDTNLIARVGRELLAEILEQFPSDGRTGSVLLGVSLPTFRRRVSAATGAVAGVGAGEPASL